MHRVEILLEILYNTLSTPIGIIIFFIVLLVSAISHELGHGYTAYLLGDDTAKRAGRLTFNPLKHIDLLGTIIFPIMTYIAFKLPLVMFKPVPINYINLKNPSKDSIKIALAGAGMNLLLIIISVVVLKLFIALKIFKQILSSPNSLLFFISYALLVSILINLVIAMFNLIPIPPLDGSWIVRGFLPVRWRFYYQKGYTYFLIIFFIFIFTGGARFILRPVLMVYLYIINFIFY